MGETEERFLQGEGVSTEWVKRRREEEREGREEIEGRDIDVQQQERFERVQKSE